MVGKISLSTTAALGLILATGAVADIAPVDHQMCTSVRDTLARTTYRAVINGVQCVVTVPAKLLCFPVAKENVSPVPPGAPAGPRLTVPYACYKVKCERPIATVNVLDQFGSRPVRLRTQRLLCAPAQTSTPSPSGAFLDGAGS